MFGWAAGVACGGAGAMLHAAGGAAALGGGGQASGRAGGRRGARGRGGPGGGRQTLCTAAMRPVLPSRLRWDLRLLCSAIRPASLPPQNSTPSSQQRICAPSLAGMQPTGPSSTRVAIRLACISALPVCMHAFNLPPPRVRSFPHDICNQIQASLPARAGRVAAQPLSMCR